MRPGAIAESEGRGYPENLCIKLHQGTSPYINYLNHMAYDLEHVGFCFFLFFFHHYTNEDGGILVCICMAFLSVNAAV